MNLLAFDTSTTACSVALQKGEQVKVLHQVAPRQHAKLILLMIQELLRNSSLTLDALDALAFGCGPGSFTGIRIASSVAQGIGAVKQIPVIPISSLAAMAQAAVTIKPFSPIKKYFVAIDAHMEKIYWAIYQINQQNIVELVGQEDLCSPEEVAIPQASSDWVAIGDGWEKYQEKLFSSLTFTPSIIQPPELSIAAAILPLASIKLAQGQWINACDAIPVYLR